MRRRTFIAGLAAVAALSAAAFAQNYPNRPVVIVVPFAVGSSRVDLQACKLEYSIVSPK